MHHSVCLKMTTLTSKEMLAQWQQHNPQFKEALRLLETDWPHALASVHCLADYLTDAFTLDGHSICVCVMAWAVMKKSVVMMTVYDCGISLRH